MPFIRIYKNRVAALKNGQLTNSAPAALTVRLLPRDLYSKFPKFALGLLQAKIQISYNYNAHRLLFGRLTMLQNNQNNRQVHM